MTLGRFETIGYTEPHALARIDAFVAQSQSHLVDIRFKPWSRWNPFWNRENLKACYPYRYVHMRGLGNLNHGRRDLPIELVHPGPHIATLAEMLTRGTSYLLLCACKDYERCHRKVVYEMVMAALGQPVTAPSTMPPPELIAVSLWD